ncbi:MAG TPA: class I SAM-dependent methyltransferase [Cellulomonas sp.]
MSGDAAVVPGGAVEQALWRLVVPQLVPRADVAAWAGQDATDPGWPGRSAAAYPSVLALATLAQRTAVRDALRHLDRWHGARVLDVGCGPGLVATWIAEAGAAQVTAVDSSAKMLAVARSLPLPSTVRLAQAALTDLAGPAWAGRFDVAFCGDVPLPPAARAVLLGCLRPGGTLVVRRTRDTPEIAPDDPELQARLDLAWKVGARRAGLDWAVRPVGWSLVEVLDGVRWAEILLRTEVAETLAPAPPVWRHYLEQRYATTDGPLWTAGLDPRDRALLRDRLDPGSAGSVLDRPGARIAQPTTFVAARTERR